MQRLAPLCRSVTGIEPDTAMLAAARTRLAAVSNAVVVAGDFDSFDPGDNRFDLIVVGLAANRTLAD